MGVFSLCQITTLSVLVLYLGRLVQSVVILTANHGIAGLIPIHLGLILLSRFGHENISKAILTQEGHLIVVSTGKLHKEPCPDMA